MLCTARTTSVCLSITQRYSVETVTHIPKLFPPLGSHTILDFPYQTVWQYSDGDPHNGASNARGHQTLRFSTNISLYFGIDARQSHSYYVRWIGNCTQCFEWYTMLNDLEWINEIFNDTKHRYVLRSTSTAEILAPATRRSTIGDCALAVAGPRAWNNLPVDLCLPRTFSTFKTHLKSHLFNISFPSLWLYHSLTIFVQSPWNRLCCIRLSKV